MPTLVHENEEKKEANVKCYDIYSGARGTSCNLAPSASRITLVVAINNTGLKEADFHVKEAA
jgi:hypothetical protein